MTLLRKLLISLLAIPLLVSMSCGLTADEYMIENADQLSDLTTHPGDVVILKNGVWMNQNLVFTGNGTAEQPITLRAETGGEVILTGNSSLRLYGEYLVVDGLLFADGTTSSEAVIEFRISSSKKARHCRVTNTKIINYNPSGKDTDYKWVSLYGHHNRVDHCHFEGKTHNGALLVVWRTTDPDYHQIDHNYFARRPDLGYNGGEIIRIGISETSLSDSHTLVENNLFEECNGEIEIISNKSGHNIYRNNTIRDSRGTLTLRHGNSCEVYNNFLFGGTSKDCGGIRIIGKDHKVYNNYLQDIRGDEYRAAISIVNGMPDSPLNEYLRVINALVVNNTLVNCAHPIVIGAEVDQLKSLPPKDCHISNNVVVVYTSTSTKSRLIEYDADPENITYRNNMMYGVALGIPDQPGIAIQDPLLEFDDIWRPSHVSPVISYGATGYPFMTFDIDGQSRSGEIDAGCDQVSEELATNRPLKKPDVGVQWEGSVKAQCTHGPH